MMDESAKMENNLTSAAAFVDGGIQEAFDDGCSICLEGFVESDPSTVTSCKHGFHLQCILEWCQRSSQCPMCWQPISFKDSVSQDLFADVESERNIRVNQAHNSTVIHHPSLLDFDLQHLPVGGSDAELEERIFQHLAAAAAMGRAHRIARRGQRSQTGSNECPRFLVFSTHPDAPSTGSLSASASLQGQNELVPAIIASSESASVTIQEESANHDPHVLPTTANLESGINTSPSNISSSRTITGQSTPVGQNIPGPSDFQSFSESLKSRLNEVSVRYKESFTKSTRGWREKLFSRSSSVADLGSEVKKEVNATVSRMRERFEARGHNRNGDSSPSPSVAAQPSLETSDEGTAHGQNSTASLPDSIAAAAPHLLSSRTN